MLNEPETALPPGQTFTPKQLRVLKASVIVMGVLLVLGFGLLLIGIYLQAAKIGKPPATVSAAAPAGAVVPQPDMRALLSVPVQPGTQVEQAFADQGRLILHLRREGESEFAVIDLATGRETQRIAITPRR